MGPEQYRELLYTVLVYVHIGSYEIFFLIYLPLNFLLNLNLPFRFNLGNLSSSLKFNPFYFKFKKEKAFGAFIFWVNISSN